MGAITGFPEYAISDRGRGMNLRTGKILTPDKGSLRFRHNGMVVYRSLRSLKSLGDSVSVEAPRTHAHADMKTDEWVQARKSKFLADNADVISLGTSGLTLQEIGQKVGLTSERVRQILAKAGVPRPIQVRAEQVAAKAAENAAAKAARVPTYVDGKTTPEYQVYQAMLQRCYNKSHPNYLRYGARGVTVCARWLGEDGFQHFYADKGARPEGVLPSGHALYSIHRIDDALIYSPETTKWATQEEQCAPGQRRTKQHKK